MKTLFPGSSCNDIVVSDSQCSSVISGHFDKTVKFWDLRTEDKTFTLPLQGRVTSLSLSWSKYYCWKYWELGLEKPTFYRFKRNKIKNNRKWRNEIKKNMHESFNGIEITFSLFKFILIFCYIFSQRILVHIK